MRRLLAWIAAVLAATLLAEALAHVALAVLARSGVPYRTFDTLLSAAQREQIERILEFDGRWYHRIDAELGWTNNAGNANPTYTLNRDGLRARRDYAETPPPGTLRVAAFGDSYVHGDEVADGEAWTAVLEALRPGLEVLNFGVNGYGLDQSLLRFRREGRRFRPHVVVLGVIADDVLRGVNVFRPFVAPVTGHLFTKPRFVLAADGTLELLPNPLRGAAGYRSLLDDPEPAFAAIVRHDAYAPLAAPAGPLDGSAVVRLVKLLGALATRWPHERAVDGRSGLLDLDSEPVRLAVATIAAFAREAAEAGAVPLVLFLPDRTELDAWQAGRAITYRPLAERLAADGVPVLDALDAFAALSPRPAVADLMTGSHYSPLGNRVVAGFLRDALARRGLLAP